LTSAHQNDPKHIKFLQNKIEFLKTWFVPRSQTVIIATCWTIQDSVALDLIQSLPSEY
jgi:hypothetical protein